MSGTVSVSFVFLIGVALYFAAYFLFLRWCARTARKVGRSPVGLDSLSHPINIEQKR